MPKAFDLIVMDIMMPELDGFSASREIRKFSPSVPIILLSARGEEYDKIHGFEIGVDGLRGKAPSAPRSLCCAWARCYAAQAAASVWLRRIRPPPSEGMVVDFTARRVTLDGAAVDLSPKGV